MKFLAYHLKFIHKIKDYKWLVHFNFRLLLEFCSKRQIYMYIHIALVSLKQVLVFIHKFRTLNGRPSSILELYLDQIYTKSLLQEYFS